MTKIELLKLLENISGDAEIYIETGSEFARASVVMFDDKSSRVIISGYK